MEETVLYANPYDITAGGFYFRSAEQFEAKFRARLPVEEYEIEFIDGSSEDAALFGAMGVYQGPSIARFFDEVVTLEEWEKPALFYVMDNHGVTDLDEALLLVRDEVRVMEGRMKDYVENLIDDLGGVGELGKNNAEMYFDYETFGRDLGFDLNADDPDDEYYLNLSNQERGEEYVDSIGGVAELGKEIGERYFDVDAFARDVELGGDATEFDFAGSTYVTDYR
ncbi:MAG: antirestriction protein ArdA [Deltaproteobacteria bacterium]|nr:antirestriction protein ArdA [Deltaproteobacteria bacterium]